MILVTIINGEDLILEQPKLLNNDKEALKYFKEVISDAFPDDSEGMTNTDYMECYHQGFWGDTTHYSVVVEHLNDC